jgi:hypothetical protein
MASVSDDQQKTDDARSHGTTTGPLDCCEKVNATCANSDDLKPFDLDKPELAIAKSKNSRSRSTSSNSSDSRRGGRNRRSSSSRCHSTHRHNRHHRRHRQKKASNRSKSRSRSHSRTRHHHQHHRDHHSRRHNRHHDRYRAKRAEDGDDHRHNRSYHSDQKDTYTNNYTNRKETFGKFPDQTTRQPCEPVLYNNKQRSFSETNTTDNKARSGDDNEENTRLGHAQRPHTPPHNQINEITSTLAMCDNGHMQTDRVVENLNLDGNRSVSPHSDQKKASSHKKSSKKKKKKDKLRRSQRIKTIETKRNIKREIEFAERLQTYGQNKCNNASSGTIQFDEMQPMDTANEQPCDLPSISNGNSPPKPFKKMLLSKAFNDEHMGVDKTRWPKFDHLDENLFLNRSKVVVNKETKRMICDCGTSEQERALGIQACGDDCLNRMLMIEWFAWTCSHGSNVDKWPQLEGFAISLDTNISSSPMGLFSCKCRRPFGNIRIYIYIYIYIPLKSCEFI